MKRIKIVRVLATYICHDPFAYSPIWTWDSFPPIIYTERERILPVLKEWEHKGYLVYPYKPKNPLIHSILCYKLFANICKFLYLYTIILADIYA